MAVVNCATMLTFPEFNPVAFEIGPVQVHWYGLMYLVGFAGGWGLAMLRAAKPGSGWTTEQVTDGLFYVALGVVLGGRIGYVLFYATGELLSDPLLLFRVWEGGMSFHGGFLGVLAGMWWFTRKYHKKFFDVMDFVAPLVTIGLGAGRLGNFINGELWGRISDVPWAMVFPQAGPEPRHPSQLYEFLLEGVVLFIILWTFSAKPRPRMAVSGGGIFPPARRVHGQRWLYRLGLADHGPVAVTAHDFTGRGIIVVGLPPQQHSSSQTSPPNRTIEQTIIRSSKRLICNNIWI
jgi:phosphatidylglycerol:prolipoprotein diacylglycerol transferase